MNPDQKLAPLEDGKIDVDRVGRITMNSSHPGFWLVLTIFNLLNIEDFAQT